MTLLKNAAYPLARGTGQRIVHIDYHTILNPPPLQVPP